MLNPSALSRSLKPLDFKNPTALSPAQTDFYRFYQIDFAGRWPELEQLCGSISSGDYQIATYVYRFPSAQKNLILAHGYFDHAGLYGSLIEYGLSRGFNVVVFDLPGHGLSTGMPLAVSDFVEYVQAFRDCLSICGENLGGDWRVIAQSTGCSVVMEYLLNQPELVFESAVLLAPLVRPKSWRWINLAHRLCKNWFDYVPRNFAKSSHNKQFLQFLRRDPLQVKKISVHWVGALIHWVEHFLSAQPVNYPLLIIQGTGDSTVDWQYNIPQIEQKFPQAQVHYLQAARHHLANESEHYQQQVFELMDGYVL